MRAKLTKAMIEKAPVDPNKHTIIWDAIGGFGARITKGGHRGFICTYRNGAGKMKYISLGAVNEISVDDARAKAQAIKLAVRDGRDPAAEIEQRKAAQAAGFQTMGVVGVLLVGKQMGRIRTLHPLLTQLQRQGFRLSRALVDMALRAAGEFPTSTGEG